MPCYLLRVTQFVVLCCTGRILLAQQMTDSIKDQGSSYFFYQQPEYPRDCKEVRDQCSSDTSSGVYLIKPDGYPEPFEVYCNNTDSEGWTVLLRRNDGNLDFDRTWDKYKEGFGFLSQEFWLGNEKLSYLTNQENYELRIDFTISDGSSCFVTYDLFRTSDEFSNYKIANLGPYSGDADNCITSCSTNMEPGDCNCQKTCVNPSGCTNTCNTMGNCVCSTGFYLKAEECVSSNECAGEGCTVDGVKISEGEFYVNADCTRRGVCTNGQVMWDNTYMCSSNEVCEERNTVRQCYSNDANDCLDIYNAGFTDSDVYTIKPTNWPGSPFQVYCNMTDEGGWTVFQRRVDGAIEFYQNWTSYKEGFGFPDHEHWLGNDKLYYLTNQKRYTIRIDFVNRNGSPYYAKYDFFRINDENDKYRLSEVGSYSGTADTRDSSDPSVGDSLTEHQNHPFSTHDQDNDDWVYNCASIYRGGWWYGSTRYHYCHYSNLNGVYDTSGCYSNYIVWYFLPGSHCNKFVEMKVRPI